MLAILKKDKPQLGLVFLCDNLQLWILQIKEALSNVYFRCAYGAVAKARNDDVYSRERTFGHLAKSVDIFRGNDFCVRFDGVNTCAGRNVNPKHVNIDSHVVISRGNLERVGASAIGHDSNIRIHIAFVDKDILGAVST